MIKNLKNVFIPIPDMTRPCVYFGFQPQGLINKLLGMSNSNYLARNGVNICGVLWSRIKFILILYVIKVDSDKQMTNLKLSTPPIDYPYVLNRPDCDEMGIILLLIQC